MRHAQAQDCGTRCFDGEGELAGVPETVMPQMRLTAGVPVIDLLVETGWQPRKARPAA